MRLIHTDFSAVLDRVSSLSQRMPQQCTYRIGPCGQHARKVAVTRCDQPPGRLGMLSFKRLKSFKGSFKSLAK